jgi:hypothetical protein
MIIKCDKCNGTGRQTDWSFVGITNIFYPAFKLMDKLLTEDELSTEKCTKCSGKGYKKIREEDLD